MCQNLVLCGNGLNRLQLELKKKKLPTLWQYCLICYYMCSEIQIYQHLAITEVQSI